MKVLRYLGGVKSEQGTENTPSFMKRRKSYRSERGDNVSQREIQVSLRGTEGLSAGSGWDVADPFLLGEQATSLHSASTKPFLGSKPSGSDTFRVMRIPSGLNLPLVLFLPRRDP